MAYTPPPLLDNNPGTPVSAAATIALHQDTYTQSTRDAAGLDWIDVTRRGVTLGPGGHGVANVAALNTLIATLTGNHVIYFPAGYCDLNGVLSPITVSNVMIQGAGMGVTILRQESTSTTGQFFTIGNATGTQTGRVTVRDLGLQCLNTAAGTLPDNSPARVAPSGRRSLGGGRRWWSRSSP